MKRSALGRWLLPALALVGTCLYPCMFLYAQNAGEARMGDMLPMLAVFLVTAAAGMLLCCVLLRNMSRSAFLTCLAMLLIINFTVISEGVKRILPGIHNLYLLGISALILLGLLVLLMKKKPNMTAVCGILALMFWGLTLVNFATAVPSILAKLHFQRQEQTLGEETVFTGENRNVYYFLFDEYGGSDNLEHFYGIDNEEFLSALEERGFSVSRTSKNPESCWTVTLIPNILNLDYVTSDQEPIENRGKWLKNPYLYEMFWENGYEVQMVNHVGYLDGTGCRVLTEGQGDVTLSDFLFVGSLYEKLPVVSDVVGRLALHRVNSGRDYHFDQFDNAVEALSAAVAAPPKAPTLTVTYLQCPHAPFLYDGEGREQDIDLAWDWRIPEGYLNNLAYANRLILDTVDQIQKNDPQAIILLQGDHGSRMPGHLVNQYGGPWFDTEAEIPYMESVLCCAYVPGTEVDIEGDTCINAARKVCNAGLGTSLPLIPPAEDYQIPKEYMPPEKES